MLTALILPVAIIAIALVLIRSPSWSPASGASRSTRAEQPSDQIRSAQLSADARRACPPGPVRDADIREACLAGHAAGREEEGPDDPAADGPRTSLSSSARTITQYEVRIGTDHIQRGLDAATAPASRDLA